MTAPTSYWDLSERERAALTREDVERYLAFELMEKGCGLRITEPNLLAVPTLPVKPRDYYGVSDENYYNGTKVLFETREQAEQFLSLRPLTEKSDHVDGAWVKHAEPLTEEIKIVSAISPADFQTHRSALQANEKAKAENKKRQEEYEKTVKAQDSALKGLWDDWYECGRKALEHDKVKRTWGQYVVMAGNTELAAKFLLKVFSVSQIEEAAEWFGISIPTIFEEPTEPGPMHPDAPVESASDIAF